jgi:hypothetical protein
MNSVLDRIVNEQKEPSEFSKRYIEFLRADLPKEIVESVVYNIVDWQWKQGQLRTDRQYRGYVEGQRMSEEAFEARPRWCVILDFDKLPENFRNGIKG